MNESETTTTMIDSQEDISGKKQTHPPKKRRTLDFFACHRSDPSDPDQHLKGDTVTTNNANNNNNNNPTNMFSCSGTTSMSTENLSLESRSRLDSSSSFSTASLSGLPAYVVDIPPIPSLRGLDCMDAEDCANNHGDDKNGRGNKKTSTPSMRSLLAIRRYISKS